MSHFLVLKNRRNWRGKSRMAAFQEFPRQFLQFFSTRVQNRHQQHPCKPATMSASKSHPNLRDLVANTLRDFSNLQDVFPLIFPGKFIQKTSKKRPATVEGVDPGDLPSHNQQPASKGAITNLGGFITVEVLVLRFAGRKSTISSRRMT